MAKFQEFQIILVKIILVGLKKYRLGWVVACMETWVFPMS